MMPNLLQYPVALFGVLRAGMTVVNVNPLYTPRELEHQLKDSGAKAIVVARELRAHAAAGDREHGGRARRHHAGRRHAAASQARLIVNFVVKHVKKMVPPWRLPRRGRASARRSRAAAARALDEPLARRTTTSRSCSTPAAPPASPRARC